MTQDMDRIFSNLSDELAQLVAEENYNPRYYAIHRTIYNLCSQKHDFEEYAHYFSQKLPEDDYIALRCHLLPYVSDDLDYSKWATYEKRPIGESENMDYEDFSKVISPDSKGNYNIHNIANFDIDLVPEEILQISEHPGMFLRKWCKDTSRYDCLEKSVEYSKKEYKNHMEVFQVDKSVILASLDLYKKFKEAEEKLREATDRIVMLENRPPHLVECPSCSEILEIHCSEETEYIKSHFESMK